MPELIVRKWDGPYSYMVFFERGFYKARRGDTAEIPFEDPSASVVIQQAVNSLLQGGTVFLKEVQLPDDVTFGSNILIVEDYRGERKFYSNNKEYRSTEETASYIVSIEDGVVKAKNGHTGKVEFSDSDAATVIRQAIGGLPIEGGSIFFKEAEYGIATTIEPPPNKRVDIVATGGAVLKGLTASDIFRIGPDAGDYYVNFIGLTFNQNNTSNRSIGTVAGAWLHGVIFNCRFLKPPADQNAVKVNLKHGRVIGNFFERDSPSGADALAFDAEYAVISNNVLHNGFIGTGGAKHVSIMSNVIYQDEWDNIGILLEQAYNKDIIDISIKANVLHQALIVLSSAGTSSTGVTKDIIIEGNVLYRERIGVNASPNEFQNINIKDNIIRDGRHGSIFVRDCRDVNIDANLMENSNMADDSWYYNKGCIVLEQVHGVYQVRNNMMKRTASLTYDTPYGISVDGGDGAVIVEMNSIQNMRIEPIHIFTYPSGGVKIKFNDGYATENGGVATIPNGSSSVVVDHGLVKAPSVVKLTGTHSEVANCWVTNVTSTQFTINAPAAVSADRDVYWQAEV